MHWKYKAEEAVRKSGLPYTIIRATGLVSAPDSKLTTTEGVGGGGGGRSGSADVSSEFSTKRRLQAGQGDSMVGRITRAELADLTAAALHSPHATGLTFEVRRDESDSGRFSTSEEPNNWGVLDGHLPGQHQTEPKQQEQEQQDFERLFRALVKDADRVVGSSGSGGYHGYQGFLPPFPLAQDPPAPVSPERVLQILNDPRVKAQQGRDQAQGTVNPNTPTSST